MENIGRGVVVYILIAALGWGLFFLSEGDVVVYFFEWFGSDRWDRWPDFYRTLCKIDSMACLQLAWNDYWFIAVFALTVFSGDIWQKRVTTSGDQNVADDKLPQKINDSDVVDSEQMDKQKGSPFGWLIDPEGYAHELLTYSITIGRSHTNDVVMNNSHVSGCHAILEFKNGLFVWTDLAPTNPTMINGKAIHGSQQIWPNDLLTVGTVKLRFVLDQKTRQTV